MLMRYHKSSNYICAVVKSTFVDGFYFASFLRWIISLMASAKQ